MDLSDTASGPLRILALAASLVLPAHQVLAATPGEIVNQEALAHAHAIEAAWHRLEQHVLHESNNATVWTGGTPPAASGWRDAWTRRGLAARYCDNVLLVYAARDHLKGVGRDQRSVRLAPHLLSLATPRPAPLHWLDGSRATGGLGRGTVDLPSCMTGLPVGRVALAGPLQDPFGNVRTTVAREIETRACPAGSHGPGRTFGRDIEQDVNGRGDHVDAARPGPWRLLGDACEADSTIWETYRLACTFDAGDPHNRVITGEDIYRRSRTVTAQGTVWGEPEFVSTSCWQDPDPEVPSADIRTSSRTQRRTVSCTPPQTGSRTQSRTIHLRSTQFPWDDEPVVQVAATGSWHTTRNNCRRNSDTDVPSSDSRTSSRTETRTVSCTPPQTGTLTQSRTVHLRSTQSPFDEEPVVRVISTGAWHTTRDNCRRDSRNSGRGRELGFDTDGDGIADYDSINDVPAGLRDQAALAPIGGHIGSPGDRDGRGPGGPAGGNDGSSGGNGCGCGGPGGGGPGDVGGGGAYG